MQTTGDLLCYYRPQTKMREGNVFTPDYACVCVPACNGQGCVCVWGERCLPRGVCTPLGRPPWTHPQTHTHPWTNCNGHTPGRHTPLDTHYPLNPPPPTRRSMSGRYASYWNAFLFLCVLRLMRTIIRSNNDSYFC